MSHARDVVIIESGGANIASLQNALARLDARSEVSADAERIRAASHVILPGVGAAGHAMMRLRRCGLHAVIPSLRQPVLGICLGMQLLFESSDEGPSSCLGILSGRARRLRASPGLCVPHMGWNTLEAMRPDGLLTGVASGDYVYYVHSYALPLSDATVAVTDHGGRFAACVQWRNFHGTQFHPERSATVGARILRNFLALS